MSWLPGIPSSLYPDPTPEAPVAEDVDTNDYPRLTESTPLVIDRDKPKSLRSEDDLPISTNSSAASGEGGSRRPRPNIKVYTKLKPNIAQVATATRGPPGGGSDSGRHEASSNLNKANIPQAPLHKRGRSVPPKAPISAEQGVVPHDEFEAYKRATERTVLGLKQQVSQMAQEAHKRDSDHAIALKDREYQTDMLKNKLQPKVPGTTNPRLSKAPLQREKARRMPKQPTLHTGRKGRNRRNTAANQDKIQYLYEGLVDRLRQAAVEMYILRAEMAQRRKDWPSMLLHTNEALALAENLNYLPMNARCLFYRGIAQFHLRNLYDAADDLEFSRACIGIYKPESEINHWVHLVNEAQGVTSANPGWFARFRNTFSRSASKPASRRPSVPLSQSSIRWRNPGGAMRDELGSAIQSAAFGSEAWPSPSPQATSHPTANPENAPAEAAMERNRAMTTASRAPRPQGKRSATLEIASFGTGLRPPFDPLREREALRERVAARRASKLEAYKFP